MKNLHISKKTIIFAAFLVITIAIAVGCVATKVSLKCDKQGCEFTADSINIQK